MLLGVGVVSSAQAETPAQIFAADSSGMMKLDVHCAGGAQEGSGFLLGPNLLMTARHVLVDDKGRPCTARATQEGTGKTARVARFMALRIKASKAPTDLAVAVLGTPFNGYDFSLSSTSPKRGALVIALGYALNQPLSLNQGHVAKLITRNKVRLLELNLLEAGGASGGPILDASGRVVGLTQYGLLDVELSVDVAHLVAGNPAQLCFGVAAAHASTACAGSRPAKEVLDVDRPPKSCTFSSSDLPFQDCFTLPGSDSGVLAVVSKCPKAGPWYGSGFLLGPRLMMTERANLIDDDNAKRCTTTVTAGDFKPVAVVRWTALERADARVPTDLALAVLASPVQGHNFTLSSASPRPGTIVHSLNALEAESTTSNRGHVSAIFTSYGIRQLALRLPPPQFGGGGGGPIVDASNRVVAVEQTWDRKLGTHYSVDLAEVANGNPHQLCVGVAFGFAATICPAPPLNAGHPSPLFAAAPTPKVCGGKAEVPPFTYCPSGPTAAPAVAPVYTPSSHVAITGCWATTADSFDESQKVADVSDPTARVYFVFRFNHLVAGMDATVSATPPSGVADVLTDGPLAITNPTVTLYRSGPVQLAPNGVTTFELTITGGPGAGAQCSASVNTAPPPAPNP